MKEGRKEGRKEGQCPWATNRRNLMVSLLDIKIPPTGYGKEKQEKEQGRLEQGRLEQGAGSREQGSR